jgi:hypothetical protein
MKYNVKTAYFDDNWNVQVVTRSTNPNRASKNAFGALQDNKYGNFNVRVAHVFDGETAELYSEIIRVMEPGEQIGVYSTYKKGDPSVLYPTKKREAPKRRTPAILLGVELDKITT